jgi:toxin CptA
LSRLSETESLRVEPGISRTFLLVLVVGHALALGVALFTPTLSGSLRGLLAVSILAGFGDALRTHMLRRGRVAVRSAWYLGAGEWELELGDGTRIPARLTPSLVLPALVVMRFSLGHWRRRSLVIPGDALPREAHRRLRVLLRAQGGQGQGLGQSERGE